MPSPVTPILAHDRLSKAGLASGNGILKIPKSFLFAEQNISPKHSSPLTHPGKQEMGRTFFIIAQLPSPCLQHGRGCLMPEQVRQWANVPPDSWANSSENPAAHKRAEWDMWHGESRMRHVACPPQARTVVLHWGKFNPKVSSLWLVKGMHVNKREIKTPWYGSRLNFKAPLD